MLQKATHLKDISKAFKTSPLQVDELVEFYIDNQKVRGGQPVRKRLVNHFRDNNESYKSQFLIVGYKGSGKSTELRYLEKELNDQYLIINYSIQSELDPLHLNYIELFITTMEKLFEVAKNNANFKISQAFINNITNWIQTKEITEIKDKYIGADAETGVDIPFLLGFFGKLKLAAKTSRSFKEELKKNIEPKLSVLINHCNLLIKEIKLNLAKSDKKGLIIVIEDLDKIPTDRANDLFFNYTEQLTALDTNVIFTFPIYTYYNIRFNAIRPYFDACFELPMIKITNKDGSENEDGINTLFDIAEARMTFDLLEDKVLLKKLMLKTGGNIRDYFTLIKEAAACAIDDDREKINDEDCEKAVLLLKKEYRNTIADDNQNGVMIKAVDFYETLETLANNPNKMIDNTETTLRLRQNLCILGYNGEGWVDVHPIVKDILQDRQQT